MQIEVALAMPERQELKVLQLAAGATVADAIEQSDILELFPGFEFDPEYIGIFGRKTTLDRLLRAGDRVEIYRPLLVDPKEVRRRRAVKQAENPVKNSME